MKIAIGVMTHNPLASGRMELVERTLKSIAKAFPSVNPLLFDNDSTDESRGRLNDLATPLGFTTYITDAALVPRRSNVTPGAGRHYMWKALEPWYQERNPDAADVIVFSDDDMEWKEGAEDKLVQVWSQAPADIAIISGLLEPAVGTTPKSIACGLTDVFVRDTCRGKAWSFRTADWGLISRNISRTHDYDHHACVALREDGYRVAQIDLAKHLGSE